MLAWYFTRIQDRVRCLPYFLLAFFMAALPGALILMQPNLGTAGCLGPTVLVMLYIFGGEAIHSFSLALILGVVVGTYSSIYIASTTALALGISKQDLMASSKDEGAGDSAP